MTCAYCGRPLCEDFVTGVLMTGDSDMTCRESPDQAHHVTVSRHYLTPGTYRPLCGFDGTCYAATPVLTRVTCPDCIAAMGPGEWQRLLLERIPAPVERLLFLKCPRCGHRTWNCHGAEHVGYQAHYMIHLIDDLEE